MMRHVAMIVAVVLAQAFAPQPALGQGEVCSASAKGSLFFLPSVELRWAQNGAVLQDTIVHLTNDGPDGVIVRLYMIHGDPPLPADGGERVHSGWNFIDNEIYLDAHSAVYWNCRTGIGQTQMVSPFTTLDPGSPPGRPAADSTGHRVLRGAIVGWAVDSNGGEIRWNHLLADATILSYTYRSAWGYNAYHFPVVADVADGAALDNPGQLDLDGVEYAYAPDKLLFNFLAAGSEAYGTGSLLLPADASLTLMPVNLDFRQETNGPVLTKAALRVWNESGFLLSGSFRCVTYWDKTRLGDYGLPNHFLIGNLQSEAGRAEVDGVSSPLCSFETPGEDVALLGVITPELSFLGPFSLHAAAGRNLLGVGQQPAQILIDWHPPPPPSSVAGGDTDRGVVPETSEAEPPASASAGASVNRASATRPGSLVYLSKVELRWSSEGALLQDTFVHLSNTFPESVDVQLWLVHGDPPLDEQGVREHPGHHWIDRNITLVADQPIYWSAADGSPSLGIPPWTQLDPGTPPGRPDPEGGDHRVLRGYIVAWAVDDSNRQISWNHLTGDVTIVSYPGLSAWSYNGYHFRAVAPVSNNDPVGTPGQLQLDGLEFDAGFDLLSMNLASAGSFLPFVPPGPLVLLADGDLTLHTLAADLRPNGSGPIGAGADIAVWNAEGDELGAAFRCITPWDQTMLTLYGPPPTGFTWPILMSYSAKARIDGVVSALCVAQTEQPLLGVVARVFDDHTGQRFGIAGYQLTGTASEAATIRATVTCPPDTDGDGTVGVDDLLAVVLAWGPCSPFVPCPADVDGNFEVDVDDLLAVITNWGPCW
jgi:hypothetical protein